MGMGKEAGPSGLWALYPQIHLSVLSEHCHLKLSLESIQFLSHAKTILSKILQSIDFQIKKKSRRQEILVKLREEALLGRNSQESLERGEEDIF